MNIYFSHSYFSLDLAIIIILYQQSYIIIIRLSNERRRYTGIAISEIALHRLLPQSIIYSHLNLYGHKMSKKIGKKGIDIFFFRTTFIYWLVV